jgi:magnesium-transporting ATPase (P-type)
VPELGDLLRDVAMSCTAVVCCRTTKEQKADVVNLIQSKLRRGGVCLAIGDGANDVPMLKMAQVGVGVFGREGRQAVQNCDYAIAQFSHLERLLLYHGRLSYLRTSKLVLYFFYKNLAFTIPQWVYGWYNGMSGTSLFDDFMLMCFNMVFTSLPVVMIGVFEKDCDPEDELGGALARHLRKMYARLYYTGQKDTVFRKATFSVILMGVATGVLSFYAGTHMLSVYPLDLSGRGSTDVWLLSVICLTGLLVTDGLIVFAILDSVTLPVALLVVFSMLLYMSYIFVSGFGHLRTVSVVLLPLLKSFHFYIAVGLIVLVSVLPIVMFNVFYKEFGTSRRATWLKARWAADSKNLPYTEPLLSEHDSAM